MHLKQLCARPTTFLSLAVSITLSCAPIPMIQSARVTGRAGIGGAYTSNSHVITYQKKIIPFGEKDSESVSYTFGSREKIDARGFFRVGIKNRAELSLAILPFPFLSGIIKSGNLKIALFDVGQERLFHNISGALFVGGDHIPHEWDTYTHVWGGIIAGTHCPINTSDLEFVCMISGSEFDYSSRADDGESEDISFNTANFSLGAILRPVRHRFLEINSGITVRIAAGKHLNAVKNNLPLPGFELTEFKIYPCVFHYGILLYIPRKEGAR
jgi:hypothetical protein